MSAYRYRHVVTLDETNLVGNVYFAHFLRWQGQCRELFLAERAPRVVVALRTGELTMATVSCAMDYYAECFGFDEIDVELRLHAISGNRIALDFEFRRGAELVARGAQTVACLRRVDGVGVPAEIPAELDAAMQAFAGSS